MTSGERMLFAVAFESHLRVSGDWVASAQWAAVAVKNLRALGVGPELRARLTDEVLDMVDDMLGTGADRVPIRSVGGTIVGELEVPR